MSRTGTARAATVSKQLRRAGFIVGRTGVNEHEADVMVKSSGNNVRVSCRVLSDTDPKLVAEQTQDIVTELVNKGYDVNVSNRTDDPEFPCVFLHLSKPEWSGGERIANRLGGITGDPITPNPPRIVTPERERAASVGPGHPNAVHGITKGRPEDPSWCGVDLAANADLRFTFDPNEVTCSRCRTLRPRELSVPDKVERAIAKRNEAARPTTEGGRDSNLKRTGSGLVIEEIVHVPAAYNAVLISNGKLKRCQCGGVTCTATTKKSFAPGHDAAMVSRWACRVAEGVAQMSDAERNILAAGGSEAMVGKVRAAVARKLAKQDKPADRAIRVRVNLTVEVTPEGADALNLGYDCGSSDAEIREFVRGYILNDAQQSAAGEFWSVSLTDR